MLGRAVDENCQGNRAFYMGSIPEDRTAYWSVGCTSGKSYLVQIKADEMGSTTMLDCQIYHAATKLNCFTKIR